jgi:hypothetical protein
LEEVGSGHGWFGRTRLSVSLTVPSPRERMLRRGWAQSRFRAQKQTFLHSSGLDKGLAEFARTERRQSPGCRQVTADTV